VEGKFSLWFLAALSLAEGNVTLDKFTDEKVNDPRLKRLIKKVKATLVRELGLGARVAVKMKDGTVYRKTAEAPRGDPANPMSFADVENKFRDIVKDSISSTNVEQIIERIGFLEELNNLEEIFVWLK